MSRKGKNKNRKLFTDIFAILRKRYFSYHKNDMDQKTVKRINRTGYAFIINKTDKEKRYKIIHSVIKRINGSFIIADPGGVVLEKTRDLLEKRGYDIRVFQPDNSEISCRYNPLSYVKNEMDVSRMIKCLILSWKRVRKSKGVPEISQFDEQVIKILLTPLVLYSLQCQEANMANIAELLQMGMEDLRKLDELFEAVRRNNPDVPCIKHYDFLKDNEISIVLKNGIPVLRSAACDIAMEHLVVYLSEDEDAAALTELDELELQMLADRKMAEFIIAPMDRKTFQVKEPYDFLISMIYLHTLQLSVRGKNSDNCLHEMDSAEQAKNRIYLIMDEKATIPDFDWYLRIMNKADTSCLIFANSQKQIEEIWTDAS